jgi:hypothetical protein
MTPLTLALAALLLASPLAPDPAPPREVLRALAQAAAGEPDVARVQAAAARLAAPAAPRRNALAALLPRLTAEVRHDEQSNRVVGLQGSGEVDYLRLTPGTSVAVRATWDLSRLVTPPERAPVDPLRRRDEAVRRATQLYFERRQLRVALLLAPPQDPVARADAELEIDRLGAELDALTGGLFSGVRP